MATLPCSNTGRSRASPGLYVEQRQVRIGAVDPHAGVKDGVHERRRLRCAGLARAHAADRPHNVSICLAAAPGSACRGHPLPPAAAPIQQLNCATFRARFLRLGPRFLGQKVRDVIQLVNALLEPQEALLRLGIDVEQRPLAQHVEAKTPARRSSPSWRSGSNLWSWQRAQATVRPSRPRETASTRSSQSSAVKVVDHVLREPRILVSRSAPTPR